MHLPASLTTRETGKSTDEGQQVSEQYAEQVTRESTPF